jgi:poly(3-hydroxybutyrate) depolymerase
MAEKQLELKDHNDIDFNRTNFVVLRPNTYNYEWHIEACTFYFGEADKIRHALEAKGTQTQDIEKHTNFVVLRPNTYNYEWHIEACTFYFGEADKVRSAVEAKGGEGIRIIHAKDPADREGIKILQMEDYAYSSNLELK